MNNIYNEYGFAVYWDPKTAILYNVTDFTNAICCIAVISLFGFSLPSELQNTIIIVVTGFVVVVCVVISLHFALPVLSIRLYLCSILRCCCCCCCSGGICSYFLPHTGTRYWLSSCLADKKRKKSTEQERKPTQIEIHKCKVIKDTCTKLSTLFAY